MSKIPATVITGFLGAGKTSVIRHMLENAGGKRIALVINEFGDLGIDRELVTGCGIEGCEDENVMELANGCICCTVADDFLPTMEALLDRPEPPEHIVIETSGLALPKPLVKAFNWPEIKSRVTVDGVVTVVDAPAVAAGQFADDPDAVQDTREADEMLDHESPLEEVFEDQLLCADMVLLNKSDLLDGDALDGVRAEVKDGVAAQVKLVDAVHGAIDPKVLLGIGAGVEDVPEVGHVIGVHGRRAAHTDVPARHGTISLAASTALGQKLQAQGLFDLFFDKWPLGVEMQKVAATEASIRQFRQAGAAVASRVPETTTSWSATAGDR